MSCAKEEGCFTFTWEIENFDIFLRAQTGRLSSPAWKTETTDGQTVWWQALGNHYGSSLGSAHVNENLCLPTYKQTNLGFRLICLKDFWKLDRCEFSLISSCGMILLTSSTSSSALQTLNFENYNDTLFGNNMQSNITLNNVTVKYKMWRNSMINGGFCIHSVVKNDIFCWCIEDPIFFSPISIPYTLNKIIEKDNMRIHMILDSESVSDIYNLCAQTLPIIDGCFSFVNCNFVCDSTMQIKPYRFSNVDYNELRTEYREKWIIGKESGATLNASCKFKIQLEAIVAHHGNGHYQITYPTSSTIAKTGSSSETVNDPLSKDLLQLYRECLLSDVTINTEGKSFSAHRSILAIRSPVFRAMFEKDEMSEGRSGVVDIDDVDSATMDRMLVFLYGGSLQSLPWGEANSLYYAADKYAVHPLKQKCADVLKAGLTVDNVCDVLVLAHAHSDEQLMKSVLDFIYDQQEVVSSPKWKELEESKPGLVIEITKELFLKRVNK